MTKVNIESAMQIKTFTADLPDRLDIMVNEFLKGIETKFVRDVKLSAVYDAGIDEMEYIALVTYSYAKVNGWTD